jgi:hypothetical protein
MAVVTMQAAGTYASVGLVAIYVADRIFNATPRRFTPGYDPVRIV